jgi:hypothetical protein
MSYEKEDTCMSNSVSSVWRRLHACHMKGRIHACHYVLYVAYPPVPTQGLLCVCVCVCVCLCVCVVCCVLCVVCCVLCVVCCVLCVCCVLRVATVARRTSVPKLNLNPVTKLTLNPITLRYWRP